MKGSKKPRKGKSKKKEAARKDASGPAAKSSGKQGAGRKQRKKSSKMKRKGTMKQPRRTRERRVKLSDLLAQGEEIKPKSRVKVDRKGAPEDGRKGFVHAYDAAKETWDVLLDGDDQVMNKSAFCIEYRVNPRVESCHAMDPLAEAHFFPLLKAIGGDDAPDVVAAVEACAACANAVAPDALSESATDDSSAPLATEAFTLSSTVVAPAIA